LTTRQQEIDENGSTESIQKEEKWLTPIQFERYCGKENCRDWKRTIKVHSKYIFI
jgi:hypothetical protein